MSDTNKLKAISKRKSAGRHCSICIHEDAETINSLIAGNKSFRAISRQINGDDSMRDAINRHAENCLKLEVRALIKEKRIKQAVNHYQEITEQLEFAKDLRLAAREYLSDETGRIVLSATDAKIQQFALETIKTVDVVLDKIAKLEGLYKQDAPNPDKLDQLARLTALVIYYLQNGTTVEEMREGLLDGLAVEYQLERKQLTTRFEEEMKTIDV